MTFIASPMRFQVMCETSNLCTLNWQQPPVHSRRHGNILNYFVSCSALHKDARREEWTTNVSTNATLYYAWFQPYRFYNCCVAAVNEAGRGNSSCQTFITHEAGKQCIHTRIKLEFNNIMHAVPTGSPIDIKAHQLNSISVFLSWKPPFIQYQNGIIQGYYIELTLTNSAVSQYTTPDQYLIIDSLQLYTSYTCRVAAYTITGKGPLSEPLTIVLNNENGMSKPYASIIIYYSFMLQCITICGIYGMQDIVMSSHVLHITVLHMKMLKNRGRSR